MANQILGPGGGPPQGAQPPQQINLDINQCPEVQCTYCDCPTFITITRLRAVPVLLMPPQGGHVTLTTIHCSNCRRELDLDTAKKWAFLKPEERAQARAKSKKALAEKADKSASRPSFGGKKAPMGVIAKKGGKSEKIIRGKDVKDEPTK